jgi:hypothetical protein
MKGVSEEFRRAIASFRPAGIPCGNAAKFVEHCDNINGESGSRSAGLKKVRGLIDDGVLEAPAVPNVTNTLTIMAPKANPAKIERLADLGKPAVRLAMLVAPLAVRVALLAGLWRTQNNPDRYDRIESACNGRERAFDSTPRKSNCSPTPIRHSHICSNFETRARSGLAISCSESEKPPQSHDFVQRDG